MPQTYENFILPAPLMSAFNLSSIAIGMIIFSILWCLLFLTLIGVIKWTSCYGYILNLKWIWSIAMSYCRIPGSQFLQRIGVPDESLARRILKRILPDQDHPQADSVVVASTAVLPGNEV